MRDVIVHCCIYLWKFREQLELCKRSRVPSVYLCTDGMTAIVSSTNSEQGFWPILFHLQKVRSDAVLLRGISRDIFMTADTVSLRVLVLLVMNLHIFFGETSDSETSGFPYRVTMV